MLMNVYLPKWGFSAGAVSSLNLRQSTRGFSLQHAVFLSISLQHLKWGFLQGQFPQSPAIYERVFTATCSLSLNQSMRFFCKSSFLTLRHSSLSGNLREGFHCNMQSFPQSVYITLNEVFLQGQFPQSMAIYERVFTATCSFSLNQSTSV